MLANFVILLAMDIKIIFFCKGKDADFFKNLLPENKANDIVSIDNARRKYLFKNFFSASRKVIKIDPEDQSRDKIELTEILKGIKEKIPLQESKTR